jgi:RimJ/RimL family protein N-acetyltransferase
MLTTPRMVITPATAETIRAEIEDQEALAALLGATVPANWPPEMVVDALPWFLGQLEAAPEEVGWFGWYGVAARQEGGGPVLVASGGFIGPPEDGAVEIGYSVLPQFYRKGYATEMAGALVRWVLSQPGVKQVAAESLADNEPSVRLLHNLGFRETGPGREPGSLHFELVP